MVALWPIPASAVGDVDDRPALKAVLEHFATRSDAHFYDQSAILAINPKTQETRGRDSDYQYLNQGEGNCGIPESLYLSLRKRNATAIAATKLAGKSPLWRVVSAEEAKVINPAWPPPMGKKREPVKTLVTLTKPGYSADGNSALVNLSFVWSIHGAEARYLLRREGSNWKVTCSQLIFYV